MPHSRYMQFITQFRPQFDRISRRAKVLCAAGAVGGAIAAVPFGLPATAWAAPAHDWDGVAQCESGRNWHINTGNGFYGGLQFTLSTWRAYGGSGNPAVATADEQKRIAENVLNGQGAGAWPVCGQHLRWAMR